MYSEDEIHWTREMRMKKTNRVYCISQPNRNHLLNLTYGMIRLTIPFISVFFVVVVVFVFIYTAIFISSELQTKRKKGMYKLESSVRRVCAGAIMHVAVAMYGKFVHFVWFGRKCKTIYICCSTSVDMIITQTMPNMDRSVFGYISKWIENGDKHICALSFNAGLSCTQSVRAPLRLKYCSTRVTQ